jgi:hypothetical protein
LFNHHSSVFGSFKPALKAVYNVWFKLKLLKIEKSHQRALRRIRGKTKIKVAFLLIHESVWKYEDVYHSMLADTTFEPVIFICPQVTFGETPMLELLHQTWNSLKRKNYRVVSTLKENGNWLDLKAEFNPDIVFFTNPYNITRPEYCIDNFFDTLTCYVPYNFGNSHLLSMFHNQPFHNYVWKIFAETDFHRNCSEKFAANRGKNVIVTGFPGTDVFLNKNYSPRDPWKKGTTNRKKFIWAPHHTIDDSPEYIGFSSFLLYCDEMLNFASKYRQWAQFAFKPHPLLKARLENHKEWGREKTQEYFDQWTKPENCQLVEGNYIDLFITSDALIHDSGSFLIEYIYTGKPVLRTDKDHSICDRLNDFAVKAYNVHYIARNTNEIDRFISDVIHEIDPLLNHRKTFLREYLMPPGNNTASENIMQVILDSISA